MATIRIGGGSGTVRIDGSKSNKISFGGGKHVITFEEFDPTDLTPGQGIQDETGSFSGVGFTIVSPGATGVTMSNLTPENAAAFEAIPLRSGYVWNATWSGGSTYGSTPVAMYYGLDGPNSVSFWIIDPADSSFSSGVAGTFNFPVVLSATGQKTSFQT
jgi:hypothetical protein